jgi:hypothetical protein
MTRSGDIRPDLEPGMEREEADGLVRVAERLREDRPLPAAAFRGRLRRLLLIDAARLRGGPHRLRLAVAAYVASGTVLLAVAAIGVLGAGPLAAS